MKNKYKNLFKDIVIFAIGSIGSKLILFIMVPLYTNFLTSSEYGISELVFTVAQLLIPFLSVVIFDAVIRFAMSSQYKPQDVLLIGLLVVLIGSVVTVFITPLIGLYDNISKWKWYLCLYIVFSMFQSVGNNYLKAIGKNKIYVLINILHTFILALLNVILLVSYKMGIRGYFISTIVSSAISLILTFILGGFLKELKDSSFNYRLMKQMVIFSIPLIFNDISWWAIHSSDKMMIEVMIGSAMLGLYTVAGKIPSLINVVIAIFSQSWRIAAIKEIETKADTSFCSNVFVIYYIFCFGMCIAINSIIKPFMSIYVGEGFVDAWRYVPILMVSASFSAISSYFGVFYSALKKTVNSTRTTVIAAFINIILNFILIKRIGVLGAVVATAISYVCLSGLRMTEIVSFLKIRINHFCYFMNAILIVIHAISVMLELNIIISVVMVAVFGVFNTLFLVVNFKRKDHVRKG